MANTLMFEVGIKSAQEQLEKIKQEFTKANGELSKLLNIKVSIDGVDAVTKALSQIGDTSALRNLRTEIAALNREFSILSKGAGGSGDMVSRGLAADIEKTTQSIDRYTNKIKELTEQRSRLVGGTRNSNYQSLTDDIMRWTSSLEGAKKKLAELNEQKNKPVASESLKKSTQDAQAFETALGRIETAIGGLKSGMSVNLTGDFSKWAQEVQNVTASVRELVEQLQKMSSAAPVQANTEATKTQTQAVLEETEAYKQLAQWREQAEKYFKTNKAITDKDTFVGHAVNGIVLGNKNSLETIKQHIYLQKDENKLIEERKLLEEQIAKSNIRKYEQRNSYQEILGVYDKVLSNLQMLKQEASKPVPNGGILDPQKFTALQEAIDKIIAEINRLQQAFTHLGENSSLSNLSTQINGLAVTLSSLSNAVKFTGSADEIAAYEAKVKSLKDTIAQLEAQAKQVAESVVNATKGISTQAEKKGSESVLADNLQKLKSRIADVRAEFNRLNESYGQAKTMGMPMNMDIEQRLDVLRRYIQAMQQLEDAAKKTTNATKAEQEIREALSKSKAFSFIQFDGNQLFSKENTRIFNKKEIDAYIKSIEQFVKTSGKFAESSGPATNSQEKLNETLSRTSIAARNASESFSSTAVGMSNFAKNVETARLAYDKTLRGISELESRISAGQKANMDKESLDFMNGLKQRAQQWADILKKILGDDMRGNPAYKAFLSQSSNILTSPQMGNMFTSLLGADWKILLKDIGSTFGMLMKFSGFNKELTLDNTTLSNWLKGEEAVRRLDNALKDLNKQWSATNKEAKTPDLTAKYEAQKRAIESLIAQIRGAMTEADRMSNRNGLSDLLGVGFKNAVGYDNTRLIQEMRTRSGIVEREEKEITLQIEREYKERQRIYEKTEKERQALIEQTAKRIKDIEASIARGNASGRDMSVLESALSKMKGQSSLLSKTMPDDPAFKKRMQDLKVLVEDTERLRKAEDKLTAAQERNNKAKIKSDNKALQEEAKSVNDAWIKYDELSAKIKELESLRDRGIKANIDVSQIDNAIAKYQDLIRVMGEIINNAGRTSKGNLTSELLGAAPVKKMLLDANTEVKSYTKSLAEAEKRMRNAETAANNLDKKILDIEARRVDFKGLDTTRLDASLAQLHNIKNELINFSKTGLSVWGSNAGEIARAMGLSAVNKEVKDSLSQLNGQLRQNERDARNAASATNHLSSEEDKLAQAIKSSTDSMKNQSQILSDLKMMATQYVSVWGAQSFIHNIIEIGGQLEKQRLSIGAILGDVAHANDLFGKIKDLAIKSPFGVVELDQFTKQLSAYGFKYNELYDMTKRLADIAAGAGTDVSRLTLAIGHVRAEGALTGYTLRQFAMNNIPMVSQLAKKLSEVEHRVVTVADVRKRVRNKEIGYEDVIDVIKNLTNEGGMFYNMQETISQSIQSRFKNLKDSLDIMYGEIAESGIGDALKDLAVMLTEMSRSWKSFIPILQSAVLSFAAYKAAVLSVSMAMGKNNMAITSNILAYKKKRAEELIQESMVRKLTVEEERLIQTRRKLTAENLRVAMSTGAMTKGEALKLVALRKVDLETTKALIHMNMFSAAEARMALNGRLLWMNLGKVGASLKLFGASAWSSVKSLSGAIFTPMNGLFAALTVGLSAKQRQDEFKEVREERRRAINERANEGYKNLLEATKNFSVGNSVNMTKTDINLSLDEMMEKLREYSQFYNTTFNEAFKVNETGNAVHTLAEQYEILAQGIENAAKAQKLFSEMQGMVTHAIETSDPSNGFWKNVGDTLFGWMLDDSTKAKVGSLKDSLEYYAESVRNVGIAENLLMRDHLALRQAMEGRGLGDVMNMPVKELMETLSRVRASMPEVYTAIRLSLNHESQAMVDDWVNKCNQMNDAYAAANLKMRKAGQDLYASLSVKYGDDMMKWPAEWREFVFLAMDAATKDVKGFSDMSIEYQNLVRDSFLKPFKISVDSDEAKEKVNDLYVDLQNLVGKTWTVKIGVKGESAWDDLETSGKKYQEADKKVKQLEKNLERLGFKPGKVPMVASRAAQKVAEEYNDAIAERRAAQTLYETYGGDVSELDKSKDKGTKKNGSGKKADEELKRLRTRIKEIQEFWREYEELAQRMNDSDAVNEIRKSGIFPSLFDKNGNLAFDVRGGIVNAIDAAMKGFNASTEERKQYAVEVGKIKFNVTQKAIKEALEEAEKDVQEYLNRQTEQWNLYRTLFEKTGDRDFAMNAFRDGMVWDDLSHQFADDLRVAIEGAGKNLNVNKLLGMTEEQAKEALKGVEGGYALWKKTSDLVRKNYNKALNDGVDAMEKQYDITEKIRIERERIAELERQRDNTTDSAVKRSLNAEIFNSQKNLDNMEYEKFKQSSEYVQFFGSILTMAGDTMEKTAHTIRDRLIVELSRGNITAHQYAKALKDVSTQLEKGRTALKGPRGAFLDGGLKGLVEYREQESAKAAQRVEEARKELEELQKRKEKGEKISKIDEESSKARLEMALQMLGNTNKLSAGMQKFAGVAAKVGKALAIIQGAFDGFAQVGQSIAETLRAYGDDSTASDWQTMADSFNAMGQAISPLQDVLQSAMNGNISGIISGVISAPVKMITGPMTAFAKMHDAALQEEIEASQARQKEMETLFQNIESVLGRVLGGVYEFARSQNSQAFREEFNKEALKRVAFDSIYQKYKDSRGLNGVTGAILKGLAGSDTTVGYFKTAAKTQEYYDMQRALLAAQQQELQRQLSAEEDKKDSDANAIADYKQQINELEDQIQFFAMDMAKALYDIDIQSWASDLTDAVVEAWENGEDAAEAYTNKVKDLMKDLTKNILAKKVMEKAFENAGIDKLITDMMDVTSGKLDYTMVPELAKALAQAGQDSTDIITRVLDELERMGYIEKGEGSGSGSVTSGIKSITENTADLLASYLNAIRADVSVNRAMIAQYFPLYYTALTSSNQSLRGIENNTAAIMRSNEVVADKITSLDDNINGLRNSTWRVPVS